jgi:hypothetical protein
MNLTTIPKGSLDVFEKTADFKRLSSALEEVAG